METTKDERTWAMIAHLSAFAGYFTLIGYILGPLIVWLTKRDGHPFVDDQAKEALNFQITCSIYAVICFILFFVFVGFFLIWALGLFHLVCMIIAAIKAADGVAFRYPLSIRFIK